MKTKHYLYKIAGAFKTVFQEGVLSVSGQSNPYAILQTAHRIEKGLTIQNPRKLWGWNKIEELVKRISIEIGDSKTDWFSVETGASVLKAYISQKRATGDREETERAEKVLSKNPEVMRVIDNVRVLGGARAVSRPPEFSGGGVELLEQFFQSRHSVRDFEQREVERDTLKKAVEWALTSPSACNRQPSKVYCINADTREKIGFENTYNANKYLLITSDLKAFTKGEYGDWTVSTSIFTAYLVMALHGLGIGSCVLRKDLFFGSDYNDAMRRACSIPRNEKIILELAIGYYKDTNWVAYSNRRNPESILSYF